MYTCYTCIMSKTNKQPFRSYLRLAFKCKPVRLMKPWLSAHTCILKYKLINFFWHIEKKFILILLAEAHFANWLIFMNLVSPPSCHFDINQSHWPMNTKCMEKEHSGRPKFCRKYNTNYILNCSKTWTYAQNNYKW